MHTCSAEPIGMSQATRHMHQGACPLHALSHLQKSSATYLELLEPFLGTATLISSTPCRRAARKASRSPPKAPEAALAARPGRLDGGARGSGCQSLRFCLGGATARRVRLSLSSHSPQLRIMTSTCAHHKCNRSTLGDAPHPVVLTMA